MSINEVQKLKEKKMYRAKELAILLGIGNATVWRYAKQGKIKAHKLSAGVTVFNIDEVMQDLGLNGDVA